MQGLTTLLKLELDTQRSENAVREPLVMASNTPGLIHALSTKQIVLSFQKQSIQCSSGLRMHSSVMLTSLMSSIKDIFLQKLEKASIFLADRLSKS
jgi:hypothetical protein